MSLLGALTHLGQVQRRYWLLCTAAYTIGGSLSASIVGLALSLFGRWLGLARGGATMYGLIALLTLVLAGREWGWFSFRLPELRRQTDERWAHKFGFITASAMWGLHIGLGFATRVTFGGFWILVVFALVLAKPGFGTVLMLVYWLGRTLSVWIAPNLTCQDPISLMLAIGSELNEYRMIAGLTLLSLCGLALMFVRYALHP
jgi:hypothetical protein